MLVDPHVTLTVYLTKGVKVELADQGLEAIMSEELGQSLAF